MPRCVVGTKRAHWCPRLQSWEAIRYGNTRPLLQAEGAIVPNTYGERCREEALQYIHGSRRGAAHACTISPCDPHKNGL